MDISFGIQQKGKRNLITDVAGITVGHCTLADGDVQTGVTAREICSMTAAPPRST